jgi:hypothetical protein
MGYDNRSSAPDEISVEDAVNVVNVINDCLAPDADDDMRELAVAAKRLVHHVAELSFELERERARRRAPAGTEARLVDGHRLNVGTDGGGRRDFLAGRPVHAGETLYLLTSLGWYPVRYESNMPRKASLIYLALPGVQEEVVIAVPPDACFAWPEELGADVIVEPRSWRSASLARIASLAEITHAE